MKKVVSLVICLLLIIGIVPISASAETTFITQDGIEYVIDTATGEAEVDYADESIVTADIPSEINGYPVTSIGDYAFEDCTSLTEIIIPDSVTGIGEGAFSYCTSLTAVTIGGSVISIGYGAFYQCTSLTEITIPDSVTSIGNSAFCNCTSLTEITIGDSVTSIDGFAFYNTAYYNDETNWENGVLYIGDFLIAAQKTHYDENYNDVVDLEVKGEYTIKDGTKIIADGAFYNCTSLTSVTIPDSVTSIGWDAFSDCTSLTSVTIPDSVTSIGYQAFYWCESLTSVTIGGSVTSIGWGAFSRCTSLTSVTIPDSVTSIGWDAFYNTAYYNDETNWENGVLYIDNCLIDAQKTHYDENDNDVVDLEVKGEYTIKDGTKVIAEEAFYECTSLTSVTIPDSVTSIGDEAFSGCTSLTFVTIPDSVTSIGDEAFGYYYDDNWETQKIESFTIYGYTGSAAETYANENDFTFISIGDMPETPTTQGDLNGDGKVSVADARSMLFAIAGGDADNQDTAIADFNGDGKLTVVDVRLLLVKIANGEDLGYNEIDYTAEQSLSEMAFDVMKYNLLLSEDGNANTTANSLTFAALNAMIAEGADDESAKILNDLFFYGNRNEAMDIVESYTDISDITLANSAFVRDGFDIKTTYTDSLKLKFNADIFTNKAFDQTTVEEINNWSFNKTNGLVGSPVNSLDIESNLVLNSVSTFSANWLFPFNKDATKEDVFTNADGSKKTVQMMTEYPAAIGDYNGNTVYMKSFENERFKFIAVMPDEDIVEYTFNFNCETLHNILTKTLMCQDVIKVCLPKFSIENEIDFTDVYKFYEINFSNISDTELTIGPVKQKNVVSIDENGVCAASAAQAVISTEVVDRTVKFDRPFMYMIVDTENEVALYSGTVCNIGE